MAFIGRVKEHALMKDRIYPTPAKDLARIHKVITRGIKTSIEKSEEYSSMGFPSPVMKEGYVKYVNSLGVVLKAHHLGEDEVLFPVLQKKLPQAPYERLGQVHREIAEHLIPLQEGTEDLVSSGGGVRLLPIINTLYLIAELWPPHVRMEESIFSQEALAEVLSEAEQADLSLAMGKFTQEHSEP